jgi:predicted Zn-dependent peptidase
MVVRGTEKLDGTQVVEAAGPHGGQHRGVRRRGLLRAAATALDRYWAEMLDLVAEIALTPSLPDGTLQAVRDFLVRQIRNRGEKPFDVALDTLLARTFGDNPYAWEPSGLKESLERVDRAALIAHYRRHYVPGGMVLAVSGNVKAADVLARARAPLRDAARGPGAGPECRGRSGALGHVATP